MEHFSKYSNFESQMDDVKSMQEIQLNYDTHDNDK